MVILDVQLWELDTQRLHQGLPETILVNTLTDVREFKNEQFKKLWMTRGIAKSIKMKNKQYRKFIRYPNKANKMIDKRYRNKLNHLLRITEKHYYQAVLEQNKKNASKTWAIIKNIINKN